jgi:hypothetical protein
VNLGSNEIPLASCSEVTLNLPCESAKTRVCEVRCYNGPRPWNCRPVSVPGSVALRSGSTQNAPCAGSSSACYSWQVLCFHSFPRNPRSLLTLTVRRLRSAGVRVKAGGLETDSGRLYTAVELGGLGI